MERHREHPELDGHGDLLMGIEGLAPAPLAIPVGAGHYLLTGHSTRAFATCRPGWTRYLPLQSSPLEALSSRFIASIAPNALITAAASATVARAMTARITSLPAVRP